MISKPVPWCRPSGCTMTIPDDRQFYKVRVVNTLRNMNINANKCKNTKYDKNNVLEDLYNTRI